ncbi:MAG: BON domain-containing protein [Verrucomicrobia bacterium]|nr:BON domain-containing protein [Verrucomicrobiota bacterium]
MLLGAVLGAGGFWFFTSGRFQSSSLSGRSLSSSVAKSLSDSFRVEDIKEELSRTGAIVREKAKQAGNSLSDAAANARITATIKGKMLAERDLPALQIGVDTTDGVVTLSGKVSSIENVARAVKLAFEVDGVKKVFSTLQVVSERK